MNLDSKYGCGHFGSRFPLDCDSVFRFPTLFSFPPCLDQDKVLALTSLSAQHYIHIPYYNEENRYRSIQSAAPGNSSQSFQLAHSLRGSQSYSVRPIAGWSANLARPLFWKVWTQVWSLLHVMGPAVLRCSWTSTYQEVHDMQDWHHLRWIYVPHREWHTPKRRWQRPFQIRILPLAWTHAQVHERTRPC